MDQNRYQSNEEKLHQLLATGDIEAIVALHRQGVDLEFPDKEGKTPLMKACTLWELLDVANTLIVLGSGVDAFCPGRDGGTPLHFAARNNLNLTIELLLSNGANADLKNDDGKTALEVARMKDNVKAVRVIENHISCFSGWLGEYHGSRLIRAVAPPREIWAVVIPRETGMARMPPEMELAIYHKLQDAHPYKVINLLKSRVKKAKLNNPDPRFTLIDLSTKTPYKFSSVAGKTGKKELLLFYDICKGVCGVRISSSREEHDDEEQLALAINGLIDSANERELADILAAVQDSLESVKNNLGMTTREEGSSSRWMDEPGAALEPPTAPPLPDNNTCIICWEGPVEGACLPCGHMYYCMACLKEIKAKKNCCPYCRAKIDQVKRIHRG